MLTCGVSVFIRRLVMHVLQIMHADICLMLSNMIDEIFLMLLIRRLFITLFFYYCSSSVGVKKWLRIIHPNKSWWRHTHMYMYIYVLIAWFIEFSHNTPISKWSSHHGVCSLIVTHQQTGLTTSQIMMRIAVLLLQFISFVTSGPSYDYILCSKSNSHTCCH